MPNSQVARAAAAMLLLAAACPATKLIGRTQDASPEPVASDINLEVASVRRTTAEFIAARRAAYHLSAAAFGEMKIVIENKGDVRPLEFGARGLARWARVLPSMFPPGTGIAPSNAKSNIWTERAEFNRIAASYESAARRLAELAKADDRAAFAAQWETTRAVCSECHDHFRQEPAGWEK